MVWVAAVVVCSVVGAVVREDRRPKKPKPPSLGAFDGAIKRLYDPGYIAPGDEGIEWLKDRYVRGEIELDEFEDGVGLALAKTDPEAFFAVRQEWLESRTAGGLVWFDV